MMPEKQRGFRWLCMCSGLCAGEFDFTRGPVEGLVIFGEWGIARRVPPGGDEPNPASAREQRRCPIRSSGQFALPLRPL